MGRKKKVQFFTEKLKNKIEEKHDSIIIFQHEQNHLAIQYQLKNNSQIAEQKLW